MSEKWEVSKHVCRVCFGRVLMREENEQIVARCADCALQVTGRVQDLCSCGAKLKTGRNAGFKCEVNEQHIAGVSQEIVTLYRGCK